MQDRWDVEHEGCRTVVMQTGGMRTGGKQDRRDAGQEGCRKGGMQDRRDAGNERSRTWEMEDRWGVWPYHHISDHFPIIHHLNLKKSKVKQHKLKTRNFSLNNVNRFKGALSNYNWSHVIDKTNCPQAAYTNFDCTLNSLVDIYVLLTTKNFNSNFHKIEPWMTVGILTSHRRKNFLFSEKLKKTNPTNGTPTKWLTT